MDNHYNLIDEKWIPIKGKEKASLMDVFTDTSLEAIGGTIIHQFAIIKLLLAIAQRACTPEDDDEWEDLGESGLSSKCVEYLKSHYDLFYLYGNKPFLQFPKLLDEPLKEKSFGNVFIPDLPSENNSILNSYHVAKVFDDADKALFIVSLMNYSLGGKRVDKAAPTFTNGYKANKKTAQSGPSLGNHVGYLQTCFIGESILNTVYLNLLSRESIDSFEQYSNKEIIPPWERMPEGEDDEVARNIKNGLMGTLCGVCRFVLLQNDGIIYTNGIQYPSHKDGYREPFMSYSNKDKVLFVDVNKRPWRNLSALLSFSFSTSNDGIMNCPIISLNFFRNRNKIDRFGILSGGLQVRTNSGDQSVKQTDDFVCDSILFESKNLDSSWYDYLVREITELDNLSKIVYSSVGSFYKELNYNDSATKEYSKRAAELFWDLCSLDKNNLIQECKKGDSLKKQRRKFGEYVELAYSHFCDKATSKQLFAWIEHKPNISSYINAKEVD